MDQLKNVLALGQGLKGMEGISLPASVVPTAEASQADNTKDANEEIIVTQAASGAEPLSHSEVEKMLFDEMLGAPLYTLPDFMEILEQGNETRGKSVSEQNYWCHPRRWKVVLWNLRIRNMMDDNLTVFVEFDFGGNREEVKVQQGKKTRIYSKGTSKNYLRSSVVSGVTNSCDTHMGFRESFEYRGSYLNLESEKLKIKVWEYRTLTLNHLEAIFEEPLLNFGMGEIHVEKDLYKFVKGRRSKRFRLSFQLCFQELYDFELCFLKWRAVNLRTSSYIQNKIAATNKGSDHQPFKWYNIHRYILDLARYNVQANQLSWVKNRSLKDIERHETTRSDSTEVTIRSCLDTSDMTPKKIDASLRITIKLVHPSIQHKGLNLISSEQRGTVSPAWDNLGEIFFRGTLKDLDAAFLEVKIEDMTAPRLMRVVASTLLPLRGVVDYPFLRTDLGAPAWLNLKAKIENWWRELKDWSFGKLDGKILIAHMPRYRQIGEMHQEYQHRIQLIIRIEDVDQIVTPDNRVAVDSYVEISFDGTSRRSRKYRNSLNPNWQEEIIIPLRLPSARDITPVDISKKGRVFIDLWGKGENYVDHLGGCYFHLYDCFFNEKKLKRPKFPKLKIDLETNMKTKYETRAYKATKKLLFIHKDERPSHLSFEVWTSPDLLEISGLEKLDLPVKYNTVQCMPARMAATYTELKASFDSAIKTLQKETEAQPIKGMKRYFLVECLDQRQERQFFPTMIAEIKPPIGIDSFNAIFHYVRCFPFILKRTTITFTPDFLYQLRSGDALDHCLLFCSFLLGLPSHAFLCLGSLHDNSFHAWVATLHWDEERQYGNVKFWEVTTGNYYLLKDRFIDFQVVKSLFADKKGFTVLKKQTEASKQRGWGKFFGRKKIVKSVEVEDFIFDRPNAETKEQEAPSKTSKLPYRTIDVVFNKSNLWMNLQSHDPAAIWYDFWNPEKWYQFCPKSYDLTPCFLPKISGEKITNWRFEKIVEDVTSKVKNEIIIFRSARNLSTKWNRDDVLESFLQRGLELLHQVDTAREVDNQLAQVKLIEWKQALYGKIPRGYRLRGESLHFNSQDSKYVADQVVSKVDFLDCRDRSITFASAVSLFNLPGEIISIYVFVMIVQKVAERERRKILLEKEKEEREAEWKRVKKKKKQLEARNKVPKIDGEDLDSDKEKIEISSEIDPERDEDDKATQPRGLDGIEYEDYLIPLSSDNIKEEKIKPSEKGEADALEEDGIKPAIDYAANTSAAEQIPLTVASLAKGRKTRSKKVKVKLPAEGSYMKFSMELNRDFDDAPDEFDYKAYMKTLSACLTEGLGISSKRIRAMEVLDKQSKVIMVILPEKGEEIIGGTQGFSFSPSVEKTWKSLQESLPNLLDADPKLFEMTGGRATLELMAFPSSSNANEDENYDYYATSQYGTNSGHLGHQQDKEEEDKFFSESEESVVEKKNVIQGIDYVNVGKTKKKKAKKRLSNAKNIDALPELAAQDDSPQLRASDMGFIAVPGSSMPNFASTLGAAASNLESDENEFNEADEKEHSNGTSGTSKDHEDSMKAGESPRGLQHATFNVEKERPSEAVRELKQPELSKNTGEGRKTVFTYFSGQKYPSEPLQEQQPVVTTKTGKTDTSILEESVPKSSLGAGTVPAKPSKLKSLVRAIILQRRAEMLIQRDTRQLIATKAADNEELSKIILKVIDNQEKPGAKNEQDRSTDPRGIDKVSFEASLQGAARGDTINVQNEDVAALAMRGTGLPYRHPSSVAMQPVKFLTASLSKAGISTSNDATSDNSIKKEVAKSPAYFKDNISGKMYLRRRKDLSK